MQRTSHGQDGGSPLISVFDASDRSVVRWPTMPRTSDGQEGAPR